jgi:hypothetical protein
VSLDEFIMGVHGDIDRFRDHWRKQRNANGKQYPDEMPEEEWQEQMVTFMGMNEP